MKIKLTEQQVSNLINKVTGSHLPDIDFEKEAPNLMRVAKDLANPLYGAVDIGKRLLGKNKNDTSATHTQFAPNIPSGNQMMHPLGHKGTITSTFGNRNTGIAGASTDHKGIDIAAPSGSPVYAPLDGIVTDSRDTTPNDCGGFVQLSHINMGTKFCHLSRLVVNKGDKVKKGQIIAYSGGGANDPMHGNSSGPHLHYEILSKSGIPVDPISTEPNLTA
jgi:murein DD-endopeptidase MepM/ murein hydrolase activator NlpD